jgi:hypothetical protein
MGAHWSKGDDLGAQVTLLNGTVWGNNNGATAAVTTNNGQGYVGKGVDVYEAWAFWKAMDNLVVKVGRGAMDVGDGTLISKNDDMLHPYAFDGVLGAFYTEFAAINFFGVKGSDTSTADQFNAPTLNPAGGPTEVNFYGIGIDLRNLPEVLKMVNVNILQEKGYGMLTTLAGGAPIATTDGHVTRIRYSATVKGDVAGFDYRGTYAGYKGKLEGTGDSADLNGSMYDLGVGYTLKDVMGLHFGALYHKDSGGDATKHYDGFFYDHHNNGGLMDVVTWGNLTYWKIGASVEPMEMLNVGLDYYAFSPTDKSDVVTTSAGTSAVDASKIGTEWDLHVDKKLSNGTMLGARYSMFSPDSTAFAANNETQKQIYAEAKFSF